MPKDPTIYEDPEYWPDTCPQHPDDDIVEWTEEEEEAFNEIDYDEQGFEEGY